MSRVLVTGATGTLGRALVAQLRSAGATVRTFSRRTPTAPADPAEGSPPETYQGDLLSTRGLASAVAGVDVIVHCATANGAKDVPATANLVNAAAEAGRPRLVYVSIVGVDEIPLPYYRAKRAGEEVVTRSALPSTILRATQFHNLVAALFSSQRRLPVTLVPAGFRFQPVSVDDVAARLVSAVRGDEDGRLRDLGGPEVRNVTDLAGAYLRAVGRPRRIVGLPIPGAIAAGYRSGANLAADGDRGAGTFEQFLAG